MRRERDGQCTADSVLARPARANPLGLRCAVARPPNPAQIENVVRLLPLVDKNSDLYPDAGFLTSERGYRVVLEDGHRTVRLYDCLPREPEREPVPIQSFARAAAVVDRAGFACALYSAAVAQVRKDGWRARRCEAVSSHMRCSALVSSLRGRHHESRQRRVGVGHNFDPSNLTECKTRGSKVWKGRVVTAGCARRRRTELET